MPRELIRTWADLSAARVPVVVVTVVEAKGSAPGKSGAKMLVTADRFHGTVGGGRIEKTAIEHARGLLGRAGPPALLHYNLVQDLGMTCGGSQTLLYESIPGAPRLVLFGAGHIARPLCAAASIAGFEVEVFDEREEWLVPEAFPSARRTIRATPEEAVAQAGILEGDFCVLSTPSHALDQRILTQVVKGTMPRYLGVIGSGRKREVLRRALLEGGVDPERVAAIHVPVGLNLGGGDPGEIAISVVAEMILHHRGRSAIEPW